MVLLIHTNFSSFVKADHEFLEKHFTVKSFHYRASKHLLKNIFSQMRLFFWLIFHILKAKNIFIWFADYHAFLPIFFAKIFRKNALIVLGGYDVTYLPDLKYGSFSNPLRSFLTGYSIKHAQYLCPVDESLVPEAQQRVGGIQGTFLVNPTGYNPNFWYSDSEKENIILTAAICDSMQRVKLKGIDFFLEVASSLPQFQFQIIGLTKEIAKYLEIPQNVEVIHKVNPTELRKFYSKSKIYVQFSRREGLPNALCESMLCECIPVGIAVNGIPTAIGDAGFLIQNQNREAALDNITKALQAPASLGVAARERIINNFSTERREQTFLSILND